MANNLPSAIKQAIEEIGLCEEYFSSLMERLNVDVERHVVPLMRVLDFWDDWPNDNEDVTELKKKLQKEIESSVLSEQERKRKTKLEAMVSKGRREEAEGLRGLKADKLFREDYKSWNDYCPAVHRMTGTSADNRIAWLRMTELTEEKLGKDYVLGVVEAKELLKLQEHPELAADALLAAEGTAQAEGRKRVAADVSNEVRRRLHYCQHTDEMTLEEFEELQAAGFQPHALDTIIRQIREKEAEGLTFEQALYATDEVRQRRNEKAQAELKAARKANQAEIKVAKENSNLKTLEEVDARLKAKLDDLDALPEADLSLYVPDELPETEPSEFPAEDIEADEPLEGGWSLEAAIEHVVEGLTGVTEALKWDRPEDAAEVVQIQEMVDEAKSLLNQVEEQLYQESAIARKPR